MSHDFQTHNIWMQHDATYNICGVQCTDLLASTAPLFSAVLSDKLWFCRDSHTFCLWPCKSWLQLIPFSANLNWRSFPFQQKHGLLECSMVHLGAKCTLESIFIFLHCKRSRKKLSFINSAGIGASNISICLWLKDARPGSHTGVTLTIFRRVYYQPKQCTTLVQITQNCMYKLALFDFDIPNIGTLRSPVIWHCLRTWVEFSFPPWPAPAPILQHVEWLVHGWKLHQEIVEDRNSRFVEDSLKWLSTVASGAPLQEDSFFIVFFWGWPRM